MEKSELEFVVAAILTAGGLASNTKPSTIPQCVLAYQEVLGALVASGTIGEHRATSGKG